MITMLHWEHNKRLLFLRNVLYFLNILLSASKLSNLFLIIVYLLIFLHFNVEIIAG